MASDDAVRTEPATGPVEWPPCRVACPAHMRIRQYLSQAAEGDYSGALATILETNPLPATCGRVCAHPCEDECRRCRVDEALAICYIKRAAADHGGYPDIRPAERRPEKVAVVGSGPAGLTAAYDLAKLGYSVTLFEEREALGGMLRWGIPPYRLPHEELDKDIGHILSVGVDAKAKTRVGRDIPFAKLTEDFDAAFIAVGLQVSRGLPIPGAELPGVLLALPFLDAVNSGRAVEGMGKDVIVIGGGNVAVDVARSAVRLGAERVQLACLEGDDEMPALPWEIEEAKEEGVEMHPSRGPKAVTGEERVTGLDLVECTSVFDDDGRFAPKFCEENAFHLDGDTVIFAIGQGADLDGLDIGTTPRGGVEVDSRTLETSVAGVFAAGDAVTGPARVVDAIAGGHRAAAAIHQKLSGEGAWLAALDAEASALAAVPDDVAERIARGPRAEMPRLAPETRKATFDEMELGFGPTVAAREAQRCLSCLAGARIDTDKCAVCVTCVRVCPFDVPKFGADGFPGFAAEGCQACGACATECPAMAITLEGFPEEELLARLRAALGGVSGGVETGGAASGGAGAGKGPLVAFVCSYHLAAHDAEAGVLEQGAGDVRLVLTPCLLRLSGNVVLKAFEMGASRVLAVSCAEDECRFSGGLPLIRNRLREVAGLLEEAGLGGYLTATEGTPVAEAIAAFRATPAAAATGAGEDSDKGAAVGGEAS